MKILFVLKQRFYSKNNSYGLINSASQVSDYLASLGHESKAVSVIDGNFIDKELYAFKPDVVVIEALWVTGDKLKELMELKRYQNIKWVVRIHSDIGFLAAETMATQFINDYIELNKSNLYISMNNNAFNDHISEALQHDFIYLPNIITVREEKINKKRASKNHIDIGCFGSLRILKNHCYQALCAMEMANRLGKKLKFHVTVDINMNESNNRYPVLKNLEEIFKNSKHELVKHDWQENSEFQNLVKEMDFGMQLSYTESFNIVAADFVNSNVPIVVSDAIRWMPNIFKTSTTEYEETISKLKLIYRLRNCKLLIKWQKSNLKKYNESAKIHWQAFVKELE